MSLCSVFRKQTFGLTKITSESFIMLTSLHIGRLRKSGGQKIDLISLLLDKLS